MHSTRTPHLLVGVLLALTLFSSIAVADMTTADPEQTTNATVTNETRNDSTANVTVGNLTVWTAPGDDFANLTSPAVVQAAKREGWLTRNRTVAEHDVVAFGLPAPGLVEAVDAATDGDSDAAAFLRELKRSEYDFRMEQTDDTTRPELRPKGLNLSATLDDDGLRVVPDVKNGTLSVVLRTDRAVLDWGGDRELSLQDHEAYVVNLTARGRNTTTSTAAEWRVAERAISFDGRNTAAGVVTNLGQRCTVVSGHTAVAPGTELQFRLRPNETGTVRATARATVDSSRRFVTCADTTGVPRNATLVLGTVGFDADYDHPLVDRRAVPSSPPVEISTVRTAPTEGFANLTSPAAVHAGERAGWLTRNRSVAVNDTVLFEIRAPDLATRIELTRGNDSATETFVRLVNRSSVYHFRMEQTQDTARTHDPLTVLRPMETRDTGGIRVVPDTRNDTLYVALRTDRLALGAKYGSVDSLHGREDYTVTVTESPASRSPIRWSVADREVSFDGEQDRGVVVGDIGQECTFLSGTTTVAPGTTLRVSLRSQDGDLRRTRNTTVDQSRQFSVCADTTGIPDDTVLRLSVDEASDFEGFLVENRTGPLIVTLNDVTEDEIEFTQATRNTSSFLALYAAPENATALTDPAQSPSCRPRKIDRTVANWTRIAVSHDFTGYSRIEFDRPEIADDRALIAVAHPNRDGKFDLKFPADDSPVCRDGALVGAVVDPSTSPAANDTGSSAPQTDGPGQSMASTDGSLTATAPPSTTADGPGFGPLTATVALLALALVIGHRF